MNKNQNTYKYKEDQLNDMNYTTEDIKYLLGIKKIKYSNNIAEYMQQLSAINDKILDKLSEIDNNNINNECNKFFSLLEIEKLLKLKIIYGNYNLIELQ